MPGGAVTPQGRTFIGIDPTRRSFLSGWGLDARRASRRERETFARARLASRQYAVNLRRLAQHIEDLVRGMFDPLDPASIPPIEQALNRYALLIEPWARAAANAMLADVLRRDEAAWIRHGRTIGQALRGEIATAPIGPAYQNLMAQQLNLITSLPTEAAARVHFLATEHMLGGDRWENIAEDILATGEVTRSRANLIARTETGRASTTFTQVRAEHIGSDGYIWRTAKDADVRKRHKELEGTFHRWDDPPVASESGQREMRYHPGAGPNCRCFPEVVLPDEEPKGRPVPRSLAYIAETEPGHPVVLRAAQRDPRLAQRLLEARQEMDRLQAEVFAAARAGDEREVERLDERLQVARRRYDDLAERFNRLR
jgi:SPP1 gp7 family putative phage head morphogenesis protein